MDYSKEENIAMPEGYERKELLIDAVWANVFAFIMLPPVCLMFVLPFFLLWKSDFPDLIDNFHVFGITGYTSLILIVLIIVGSILHELIHGIFFAKYAVNGWKSIKFGVMWKMLAPYCHCKEPLKVRHYIIAAIMPVIILGLIPGIVSLIWGSPALLISGVFFTVSGGGDILIIWSLRNENKDDLVQDHPSKIGCYVFKKIAQQ
jgi:hypothetical protein